MCSGSIGTGICEDCRRLCAGIGNNDQLVMRGILAVQIKQFKQAAILNAAITDIIAKLSSQADREIKSMEQNSEYMERAKAFDDAIEKMAVQYTEAFTALDAKYQAEFARLTSEIETLKATAHQ